MRRAAVRWLERTQAPPTGWAAEAGSEAQERRAGAAEGELEDLGPAEVAVDRVVEVHADPAVEVLGGVDDTLGAVGRPELGDHQLVVRHRGPPSSRQMACSAVRRIASVSM